MQSQKVSSSHGKDSMAKLVVNKRYNRLETGLDHLYYHYYGTESKCDHVTEGMIKCKLLHGNGYSLIVPDQLFIGPNADKWIQPLAFMANIVMKCSDDEIVCDVSIDISCGHTLRIRFFNHDLVVNLQDGSQLYKCKIRGPSDLVEYATGDSFLGSGNVPHIRLYHHTTPDARSSITASSQFRTSPWNIQGTTKKLINVAYAYFTPLDRITCDNDLRKIAMATGGELELLRDGFNLPTVLPPDWRNIHKDNILVLPVYPCDPSKRGACLALWIDTTVLAPQHIYWHEDGMYYEFPHSFIHRIGTMPGKNVSFDDQMHICQQPNLNHTADRAVQASANHKHAWIPREVRDIYKSIRNNIFQILSNEKRFQKSPFAVRSRFCDNNFLLGHNFQPSHHAPHGRAD